MESVSNAIKRLMMTEPFYSLFAAGLQRTWSKQVKQMGVAPDGLNYKLLINQDYWKKLDKKKQIGLIKHNILHLCFFHVSEVEFYRSKAKSFAALQMAFDLEVNSYIDEECWPDDGSVQVFINHPYLQKKQGTCYYLDLLNDVVSGNIDNNIWGNDVNDVLNELNNYENEHNVWNLNITHAPELMRTQLEYHIRAAAEGVSRGNLPGEITAIIDGLFTFKKPIFNWKKLFRQFLATSFDCLPKSTRRKESTRFEGALGHKLSKKHTILVGVDTSGSIGQEDLDEFFSEIYHVWKARADIDIIEFDTKLNVQYKYKGKTPNAVSGRGGTDFEPFVNYFNNNRKKYTLGIMFTDGYAPLNNIHPMGKFCWVISSNGDQNSQYPGYKICVPKTIE